MIELASQNDRRDELCNDVPRRARRLGAVVRIRVGNALADSDRPTVFDGDEDELAIDGPPEARLEVSNERQVQQTQLDAFDQEGTMLPHSAGSARG